MESKISFIVPGEPQGKLRPRWSPMGTYTPKKTVEYETYIKEIFVISYPDFRLLEGALRMQIIAWVMIPKSTSKKKQKLMEERIIRPTKKPDFDNIIKAIADALEGLAYKNDNQIVTCIIHKYYSVRPRLEIEIYGAQI
ncbi:hypothetical protein ES703_115963 [subsurface metagenome]